jgi:hypothetical protein
MEIEGVSDMEKNHEVDIRPYTKTRSASKAVGLSASWLFRNWQNIPAARKAGRALRWDLDELKDWMRSQAGCGEKVKLDNECTDGNTKRDRTAK